MATQTPNDSQHRKRPRFWLGPLLAGICFALGYGITQRVMTLRGSIQQTSKQTFQTTSFPGERLEQLRRSQGITNNADLQADVAAIEAKQQKEKLAAAAALRRKQELQASLQPSEPVLPEPPQLPPSPSAATAPPPTNPMELPAVTTQPSITPSSDLLPTQQAPAPTTETTPSPLAAPQTFTSPSEAPQQP
ncbi:MAG: hypothetical protein AB8A67_07335 [Prochlorococcus sp.]